VRIEPQRYFEDLETGMEAAVTRTVTEFDVIAFAGISGDANPIHLDEAYARKTRFGGRIAHGMLSASLLSAVLGTRLPGPGAIYMSQTLFFRAPVMIGAEVTAAVRIVELIEAKSRVRLACACLVGEDAVIEGEALMYVPKRDSVTIAPGNP
jgi:3-hydroxybutyryl-CoA dehydratase